ncbi:hypothetical protein IAU60_006821 [Kwoniella sp. DSM 27419]
MTTRSNQPLAATRQAARHCRGSNDDSKPSARAHSSTPTSAVKARPHAKTARAARPDDTLRPGLALSSTSSSYLFIGRCDHPPYVFCSKSRLSAVNRTWLKHGTIDELEYLLGLEHESPDDSWICPSSVRPKVTRRKRKRPVTSSQCTTVQPEVLNIIDLSHSADDTGVRSLASQVNDTAMGDRITSSPSVAQNLHPNSSPTRPHPVDSIDLTISDDEDGLHIWR